MIGAATYNETLASAVTEARALHPPQLIKHTMGKKIVATPGDTRNRLTFLHLAEPRVREETSKRARSLIRRGLFKCSCGRQTVVDMSNWTGGHIKSCGCLQVERLREAKTTHGHRSTVRPQNSDYRSSPEYRSWRAMVHRTTNPSSDGYAAYGGAGVGVCERWRTSFESFYEDMGPRPSSDHTLDRIDNSLVAEHAYAPENCRWASKREQAENTCKSRFWITPLGKFSSARKAAEAHGLSVPKIHYRCGRRGYPPKPGYDSELKYPEAPA